MDNPTIAFCLHHLFSKEEVHIGVVTCNPDRFCTELLDAFPTGKDFSAIWKYSSGRSVVEVKGSCITFFDAKSQAQRGSRMDYIIFHNLGLDKTDSSMYASAQHNTMKRIIIETE